MGFIPDHLAAPPTDESVEIQPIARSPNVQSGSATRIRLDHGVPVYGHEVPLELGFWPREIPPGAIAPRWNHRFYRLELRHDRLRASRPRTPPKTRSRDELEAELTNHSEACATARANVRVGSNDASAREHLARCLARQGKTLLALERLQAAHEAFGEAVTFSRTLADERPKHVDALIRRLDDWILVLELLGQDHQAKTLRLELVERGTMAPGVDSLIVAEVPFAGRRRCDRAVLRQGYHDKDRAFGPPGKLASAVAEQLRKRRQALPAEHDALLELNVPGIVLDALECPSIVARDPFTSGNRVLIAGISTPSEPFHEPRHDYTPKWSVEDEMRTGWVVGVCTDATEVHAEVLAALEPMIRDAEDGELWVHPPGRTKASAVKLEATIVGGAIRDLASGVAWQAMAGVANPSRRLGQPVAKVAKYRLNELLYNLERKRYRHHDAGHVANETSKGPGTTITGGLTDDIIERFKPELAEQLRRVQVKLDRGLPASWAQEGKALIAMCAPRAARSRRQLIAIGAARDEYRRRHARHLQAEEVVDFIDDWLEHAAREH